MLDLMGPGYILEHCYEAYRQEQRETQYRAYVTEGIRMMSETIANINGGSYLNVRWLDMIDTANAEKADQRDGKEIAMERLEQFGITVSD